MCCACAMCQHEVKSSILGGDAADRRILTANEEKHEAQMNQISQGFLPILRFCESDFVI